MGERGRQNKPTACWTCKRACGGCPWSEVDPETGKIRYQPVEGWVAEKTNLYYAPGKRMTTYHVIWCPLREDDGTGGRVQSKYERSKDALRYLVAKGASGYTIGRLLGVSESTARYWRKRLRGEMGSP